MELLISILISSVAVFVTGYILPGIQISNFGIAIVVAIILGVINTFIRPVLLILTLPINILTLGLLTFVIMGFSVWLASLILPGFEVENFWWCIIFAIVLACVNWLISWIF